jgi:hypothetical protein
MKRVFRTYLSFVCALCVAGTWAGLSARFAKYVGHVPYDTRPKDNHTKIVVSSTFWLTLVISYALANWAYRRITKRSVSLAQVANDAGKRVRDDLNQRFHKQAQPDSRE